MSLDQHSRRTGAAAVKITTGKSYSNIAMGAIRSDLLFAPYRMSIDNDPVSPGRLIGHLPEWERYFEEMPLLLFHKKIMSAHIRLSAPMILAVVHYRRRAGGRACQRFFGRFLGRTGSREGFPGRKGVGISDAGVSRFARG